VIQTSETRSDSAHSNPILLAIYREVRVGMVVVMVMLAAAVLVERISATRLQSALSEYYYTSAHSIFIAALLALSTLFFVYKGRNDTEDALLTLAGVCTFTAALVPQAWPVKLYGSNDLRDFNPQSVIQPNIWAIVIALVLGWSLLAWLHRRSPIQRTGRSLGGTLSLYFLRLVVAVGLITLIVPQFRPLFIANAHGVAGTLMIFSFIATAFCTAYVVGQQQESPHWRRYHWFYRVIAWVMLATLIGVVTAHLVNSNWLGDLFIIVLETLLILQFAAYWVVQTIELWDTPDPRHPLAERAPPQLSEVQTKSGRLREMKTEFAEARKEKNYQSLL
jgi:hypothetical protein